jgi:hypothetical protein
MNLQKILRDKGYSVTVVTRRGLNGGKKLYKMESIREFGLQKELAHNMGEVEVRITTPDDGLSVRRHAKGVSSCHKHDRFNKQTGLVVAFARALEQLGLEDEMEPLLDEVNNKQLARQQKEMARQAMAAKLKEEALAKKAAKQVSPYNS